MLYTIFHFDFTTRVCRMDVERMQRWALIANEFIICDSIFAPFMRNIFSSLVIFCLCMLATDGQKNGSALCGDGKSR